MHNHGQYDAPVPNSLESLLFTNSLLGRPEKSQMNTAHSPINWKMILFAILLVAIGILTMYCLRRCELAKGIGEALIVAGTLSFGIDPLLKRDLLEEASRGIFIHLLGFEHHPQVKDKLREIVFGTTLLRAKCDIQCWIEIKDDSFLFTAEYTQELVNPTNNPIDYQQSVEWDMAHKAKMIEMSFHSSDGKYKWSSSDIEVKETPDQGVNTAKGKKFTIQPSSKNVSYKGIAKYQIKTLHGYVTFNMGRPTLNLTLRAIGIPPGYEVRASPSDIENQNYWEYTGIRMRGEHVTMRWRKIGGEWL
jgi:hypothetical protein